MNLMALHNGARAYFLCQKGLVWEFTSGTPLPRGNWPKLGWLIRAVGQLRWQLWFMMACLGPKKVTLSRIRKIMPSIFSGPGFVSLGNPPPPTHGELPEAGVSPILTPPTPPLGRRVFKRSPMGSHTSCSTWRAVSSDRPPLALTRPLTPLRAGPPKVFPH